MRKTKFIAIIISIILVSVVVIPIAINESYKHGVVYVTKWDATDVLSFYGTLLGAATTAITLIGTIQFTRKQIQRNQFLEDNRRKWEKVESIITQALIDVSPLRILNGCEMDMNISPIANLHVIISKLQSYAATAKTSLDMISCYIDPVEYTYAAQEISAYVHRVVENMTEDELAAMETAIPTYARKIQDKIDGLERAYRTAQFKKWLDSGKVVCRESYVLSQVITPAETIDTIPYSLYDAEKDDMNQEERNLIDIVVGLGNIRWWHRIIDRKGFRLNGNINHYPDFMVMTKAGKLVLIEFKGDDRDNSDSRMKLELGRQWQAQAGPNYRYFMVFKNKDFGIDGAYKLEQFVEIMRDL